jgi:hypothetical protein
VSSVAVAARGPSLVASTAVIAKRSLLKFVRTPQLFWTMTVQGVMFLLIFRYIFGGAIAAGQLGYVDFVIPGILTTGLIWQGMGASPAITEDRALGLFDRLRSLPIPRSAVLTGRALADTATQTWGLVVMTIVSFLAGFQLHAAVGKGLAAVALGCSRATRKQHKASRLSWCRSRSCRARMCRSRRCPRGSAWWPRNQPVTFMIDAVRTLTGGARAEAMLGHPASYYVVRSLIWSAIIIVVFGSSAIVRYRRG